ncbi:(2Fe-2S) ferredoxin domain-containing protein [Halalkalibacterium ligniniphilum]|uniref:(2Fe-2S) ferredoxin domain-containing protein n=1 Tax=Halalkalibacterium ligniniphilum TaxID=1134413 RepID=UPI0003490C8A|nr:(2Fe-2S) ferredoxin domain-containing protein [Halalkalibacterium ligniniphilum]
MTTWNLTGTQKHMLICNGSSCMRKGGEEVTVAIRDEIKNLGLDEAIHTTRTRCNGRCKDACVVIVYPEGTWYKAIDPEIGRKIVNNYLSVEEDLKNYVSYQFQEDGMTRLNKDETHEGILKIEKEKA